MYVSILRRSLLAAAAALFALSAAAPIQAAPPEFFTITVSDTRLISGCAFPVELRFDGIAEGSILRDKNGNLKLQIFRYSPLSGVTYTNIINGKYLTSKTVGVDQIRFQRDGTLTLAFNGMGANVTLPGLGMIEHDVGHVVLDATTGEILFIGGPHPAWIGGNIDALCQALA